jgi:hypothetical protein
VLGHSKSTRLTLKRGCTRKQILEVQVSDVARNTTPLVVANLIATKLQGELGFRESGEASVLEDGTIESIRSRARALRHEHRAGTIETQPDLLSKAVLCSVFYEP